MQVLELLVVLDSTFSLVRKSSVNPFDAARLATELLTKEQVTGLVKPAFPRAHASDTKAKQPAVNALFRSNFVPDILHVASIRFGYVTCDIVGKRKRMLCNELNVHVCLPKQEQQRVVVIDTSFALQTRKKVYLFL